MGGGDRFVFVVAIGWAVCDMALSTIHLLNMAVRTGEQEPFIGGVCTAVTLGFVVWCSIRVLAPKQDGSP